MRWNCLCGLAGLGAVLLANSSCSSDTNGPSQAPIATEIVLFSGDGQLGFAGSPLPNAIAVKVLDQHGNAMAGAQVKFVVTVGGGSVGSVTVGTDANGLAGSIWTLGSSVGADPQHATAAIPGVAGSPVTFTANAFAP